MKKKSIILSLLVVFSIQYSCTKPDVPESGFKEMKKYTIYDYLINNQDDYSSFLQILQAGGMDKTLSAYNPGGTTGGEKYTLFLPDNKAVDDYIQASNGEYNSLKDLLDDAAFCEALSKYHILNKWVATNEFPFGTFNQPTLSNDYLNVNFDVQPDTTYYKINNQARVIKANLLMSNGYIQVIGTMLKPITLNAYGWLKKNTGYSIFTAALEATGISTTIDVDMKLKDQELQPFTTLVEPDAVYRKRNINSFEDLAKAISPDRTDYTNITNPLNLYVGYHLLLGRRFLNDLAGKAQNYNTFADVPMNINGEGIDIIINKYKETFVSASGDTTDYVSLDYDQSNVNTQSGPIHFVDQVLKPQVPSQSDIDFAFWEEPIFNNKYRVTPGTYYIENHDLLKTITWSDAKLSFVKSVDPAERAWNGDYVQIQGDFTIVYNIPKLIQGKYTVELHVGADYADPRNPNKVSAYPLVELSIDGNKLGGLIDLTKGGSATDPYVYYTVGTVDFKSYATHAIQVKSLIPGRFIWDVIRFKTIKITK
ncbi:MAG TPA: fasciclin domain-containing protein [Prolixibacteraceae bacterium]|jgi:uncharacterized surface protein with fasciclin (FAS1) repeats